MNQLIESGIRDYDIVSFCEYTAKLNFTDNQFIPDYLADALRVEHSCIIHVDDSFNSASMVKIEIMSFLLIALALILK